MPTGVVRFFSVNKATASFGPTTAPRDIFVHSGAVKRAGLNSLHVNQRVSYNVRNELDGRRSAVDLKA